MFPPIVIIRVRVRVKPLSDATIWIHVKNKSGVLDSIHILTPINVFYSLNEGVKIKLKQTGRIFGEPRTPRSVSVCSSCEEEVRAK